jgi:preprotein translocase subunit SecE
VIDKIKFWLALSIVGLGIFAYYHFADLALVFRVLMILAALSLGVLVGMTTESGREFWVFAQDAYAETKRVVWPTGRETRQTTLVVFGMVLIMGIFLWLVDWGFLTMIQRLLGRTE